MSGLILPGSDSFDETVKEISGPTINTIINKENLIEHTVMLNTAKVKSFQCGGLSLGLRRPYGIIDSGVQQEPVRRALAEGKLIDVTGQNIAKGFKYEGGETSGVAEVDTGIKVYMYKDPSGQTCLVSPKDNEQQELFESELKEFGYIKSVNIEAPTGLSSLFEEEIVVS